MNRKYYPLIVVVAIIAVLMLAGSAGAQPQAVDVPVTLHEFKVELSQTSLPANTPIHFIFTNTGVVEHEAVLEKAGVDDQPLEIDGAESEVEEIMPGMTKDATWTLTEPGDYQIACHTPGHYQGGMVTTFKIVPPAATIFGIPVLTAVLIGIGILAIAVLIAFLARRSNKGKAAGQTAGMS